MVKTLSEKILEAISALADCGITFVSRIAICKYLYANYGMNVTGPQKNKTLMTYIKKRLTLLVEQGVIIQRKQSFRIARS